MFLKNAWYVAATVEELGRSLLPRTIMNEPLVMFRKESGAPLILQDQCVHRQAPLSLGEIDGDQVRCLYHGLTYDGAGKCTHIPGQSTIPPGAEIRAYPAVEKYTWIWVWMGDPAKADEDLIPDFHWADASGWRAVGERIPMIGHYMALVDNLMDLSHLAFTHRQTIGASELAEQGDTTHRRDKDGNSVVVDRFTANSILPPGLMKLLDYKEPVDRWQHMRYVPPASIMIESNIAPKDTVKTREEAHHHWTQMILNFITPETDTTLHYFWRQARNYALDSDEVDAMNFERIRHTFGEDTEMVEGLQRNIEIDPEFEQVDIHVDAGPLEARRILDHLLQAEQESLVT